MKILLTLMHPDEWNQLLPFNSFINTIKTEYEHVIAVIPYKGYIVASDADEIITVTDGHLFSYPSVLDKMSSRRNDEFLKECVDYCFKKYGKENITIKSWQNTNYDTGIVNDFPEPILNYYQKSFLYAKKFFDNGLIIKPTEEVYNKVLNKYGELFDDNTFILMTRNFKNKAKVHNTLVSLPHLENIIKYLTTNGIKIINIGFPPQPYNIEKNYLEISEDLTQDELISLFYLSKGVITGSDAGGFVTHFGSNVDFFILNEEWSVTHPEIKISLVESKKTNQTISLIGLDAEQILNKLIKYGRIQKKEFSKPKILNIIDNIK